MQKHPWKSLNKLKGELGLIEEDFVNGLLFTSITNWCPYTKSTLNAMIVVDLKQGCYLELCEWNSLLLNEKIFLDSDRNLVYYFFRGGKVLVYDALNNHEQLTEFNCGVNLVNKVALEGTDLKIWGRHNMNQLNRNQVEITCSEVWKPVIESLEMRLPSDLVRKIIRHVPMYVL